MKVLKVTKVIKFEHNNQEYSLNPVAGGEINIIAHGTDTDIELIAEKRGWRNAVVITLKKREEHKK